MARDVQITFDSADPAGLAAFWADALGYRVQDPPAGFPSWDGALEAEAERLTALGATRIRRFEPAPPLAFGTIVMADPEGNEFCLD